MNETIRIYKNVTTSKREIKDLFQALLAIALVFTIATGGFSFGFVIGFAVALFSVGIAFLFHELAHKIVAQKYGYEAQFVKSTMMLMISVVLSFLGMILIAPGAVMIRTISGITTTENGRISLAGPVANLMLGFAAIITAYFTTSYLQAFLIFSAFINCLIGLFNMIPVWLLDGKKIFVWDKTIYTGTLVLFFILYIMIKIPLI